MERATHYIARKEEFQKAITDQGQLRVIAVYPDGVTTRTELADFITKVVLLGSDHYDVTLNSHKNGASLKLITI